MFQTPVDIANRGLQHIGATRISEALGFTEDSKQAGECAFAYDKLRRAELRRNVWRFATRLAVLRPFTLTTMEMNAPLWSSLTTYFIGSIVSDIRGQTWISLVADNLNSEPGSISNAWDQYFGPLACDAFDANTDYYAGDVVYVSPGDGTFQVYISQMSSNGVDPTLPAVWLASNTYFRDQIVVVYPTFAIGTTYAAGNTVIDVNGNLWTSVVNGNVGHTPSSASTAFWASYPAPSVYPGGTSPSYAGFLNAPTGGGPPLTFGTQSGTGGILEWSSTTSYNAGTIVSFKQIQYVSIGSSANLNLLPPSNVSSWAPISNGTFYQSLVDLNSNQPPASSASAWTTVLTQTATNGPQWLAVPNVYLTVPFLVYPLGSGPAQQTATRNVFRLPANFLREAPQDPKAGSTTFLGAPTGLQYTDWEYQGNYIVSRTAYPIVYRFVADVANVDEFDDMFCEGLAARVGAEVCQILTQSDGKVASLFRLYGELMSEARAVNGIETGSVEPSEDDFVTTRA